LGRLSRPTSRTATLASIYRALKANGHEFTSADFETFEGDYDKARAFVFSTNFQRRQMTNKEKEGMIRIVIERYPEESDRGIARICGISSHSQVAVVRDRIHNPPEKKQFEKLCEVVSGNLDLLYAMAVTSLNGNDFARALDRAIMRSGKLIEAKAIEPPQPE